MADDWVAAGERAWAKTEPSWGIWEVPDSEVRLLPEDMTGLDAIELGCGTGYVSAWMARRGARVTGIDLSERQLATARRLRDLHDLPVRFVHGDAEATGLPDASFDVAISEYGAAIWCDPYVWIPEAHRLLRPGGRLAFLGNHPLATVCASPDGDAIDRTLHRSWFDLHRTDWTDAAVDPGGIEFALPLSGWFALLARVGFAVVALYEPRPRPDQEGTRFTVDAEWARSWPSELAIVARKR